MTGVVCPCDCVPLCACLHAHPSEESVGLQVGKFLGVCLQTAPWCMMVTDIVVGFPPISTRVARARVQGHGQGCDAPNFMSRRFCEVCGKDGAILQNGRTRKRKWSGTRCWTREVQPKWNADAITASGGHDRDVWRHTLRGPTGGFYSCKF